ncbi:ubiquinol oxidase subunit II [Buchnera aphidicola]|uniref:ubiquinol oxidase subunit II n=1 Tax=Buchnera aphidicola TaxID=9 RepID=UPI002092861D|nr:ubiquinol oxidase subunit II [Buchnera aphidicola]USS94040.1 ubiquinol oxidase subunit II [Buchnera aphidicola (Sipha maydis)]
MNFNRMKKFFLLFFLMLSFSGFHGGLFSPGGAIALEERNLIFLSFAIMLIIVVPVIVMTIFFSYRYYHVFKNKEYNPTWDHSYKIEGLTWGIPILIIFFLGILSWKKTHSLDPSKPLSQKKDLMKINVISANWKWIFIYPKEKIIVLNEVFLPKNIPINFNITSTSVMNSFFIPSLGSQIYSMPGMTTKLHLIANISGFYKGFSANYSGEGFSDMKFNAIVSDNQNFYYAWVNKVKKVGKKILNSKDLNDLYKNNHVKYLYFTDGQLIKNFFMHN